MGDVTHRARELVIKASSDSTSGESRKSIATEIDQLTESVKQEANTTFAGATCSRARPPPHVHTRPGAMGAGADAYAGNSASIARQIDPGVGVQVNSISSDVLGNGQTAGDNKLLHVLGDIAQDLRSNDGNALRGSDVVRLDANLDEIRRQRAVVGATSNRLETAGSAPARARRIRPGPLVRDRRCRYGQSDDRLLDAAAGLPGRAQVGREHSSSLAARFSPLATA